MFDAQRPWSLPNVPLADKDTGMVDAFGKSELEHLCLQSPLQEIFNLQAQDVIELHLTLIQHTDPHQTPEQSITCKNAGDLYNPRHTECIWHLHYFGLIDEEFLTPQRIWQLIVKSLATYWSNV